MKSLLPTLLAASAFCSYAAAQSYDPVLQWSNTVNTDTSLWSYRYGPSETRDGAYPLLGGFFHCAGSARRGWHVNGADFRVGDWASGRCGFPYIAVHKGGRPWTGDVGGEEPVTWKGHSLLLHPPAGGLAVLSFRVPAAGTVQITYTIADIDPYGGNGIAWYIDVNDASGNVAGGTLHSRNGHVAEVRKKVATATVQAGDRINFVVDPEGDNGYDSTTLRATIVYQ